MIRLQGAEPGSPAPAIVGLGSPHGDDQVGWIAVDRLRLRLPGDVHAVKAASGVELLGFLAGQDDIIILDAAAPASRPGTIRSFVWPCADLAARGPWSTHGLGLVEALRLAQTLGRIPGQVVIATVEAQSTAPGLSLSRAVARGLDDLVESILRRFSPDQAAIREDR
jgi:hydrogenase maturation protease